jgi:6-pyruvoyltetrahydropterin/6-carboxytetrahydropterin synthase
MFEVSIEKTIACAHRLFGYCGPCEQLHGHNYRIVVAYQGEELDQYGMLVDFAEIKKVFYAVLGKLDHTYLNELEAFKDVSPSAENIARHVYLELKATIFSRAKLAVVTVFETPTQLASYRES